MPDYGDSYAPWYEYSEDIVVVIIETGVTTVGNYAFYRCLNLPSITLPNSLTSIGDFAFQYCTNLMSVTFPKNIISFGYGAFANCTNLALISNLNPIPINIENYWVFYQTNQSACTLKVPRVSVSTYNNTEVWKEFYISAGDYNVQVRANNNGHGYAVGSELYLINATATVSATAFYGCRFASWTKDGMVVSTDNPYRFTVIEDVELVANFVHDVGIIETWQTAFIQVYPNPTTGKLRIDNGQLIIANVEIFDVYGRKLSFHHLITSSSHHLINISHLPAGIYFLKINNQTVKVVNQ